MLTYGFRIPAMRRHEILQGLANSDDAPPICCSFCCSWVA